MTRDEYGVPVLTVGEATLLIEELKLGTDVAKAFAECLIDALEETDPAERIATIRIEL